MKIDVTNGAKEYVVARVTERNGLSLEAATITVGLGAASVPPETWQTPDVLDITDDVATASLLIDSVDQIGTKYLWVRVADTPEVFLLKAGASSISIV